MIAWIKLIATNKFLILAVVAFLSGWIVNGWRHDAKVKKAVVKALKHAEKQNKIDIKLAKKHNEKLVTIEKKSRKLIQKVDHAKNDNTHISDEFSKLYDDSL